MRVARVIGTVTATAKDAQLTGHKLLLCDIIDGSGKLLEPSVVAADTCGAGVGDTVMIVTGSGARLPAGLAGVPIDASIIAIVEHITISKKK
jgi:ethanolamine utilization protein EutN